MKFAFFGTSRFSVITLDSLKSKGLLPEFIVTTTDKPQGRKMLITPPPAKVWAQENNIPVYQFTSLRNADKNTDKVDAYQILKDLQEKNFIDAYIVASYGLIIPDNILSIPPKQSLNIHPSLLPLYRGASPLQSSILDDQKETGVTIILMDKEMDHGPIVAQQKINMAFDHAWPLNEEHLESILAEAGASLLAESLPSYIEGNIKPTEQDHVAATYTKKFSKQDGLIDLASLNTPEEAHKALLKVYAFHQWPGTFMMYKHNTKDGEKEIRVKIIEAEVVEGKFIPTQVVPEGSKQMSYTDFLRGHQA